MVCLDGNCPTGIKSKHSLVEKMPRIQLFQRSLGKREGRRGRRMESKGEWGGEFRECEAKF